MACKDDLQDNRARCTEPKPKNRIAIWGIWATLLISLHGLAGPAQGGDPLDLWIQSMEVDSMYVTFDSASCDPVTYLSNPLTFRITVVKDGTGTVPAGTYLHLEVDGFEEASWELTDDPVQEYEYVVHNQMLDYGIGFIDHVDGEFDEGNNALRVQIDDGCLCTLNIPDPSGSGAMQLDLFKNIGTKKTRRYPYALLILPPWNTDDAQPTGTMGTSLVVSTSHSETEEESAGVTAGLAISTSFGIPGFEVETGVSVETSWETATGKEVEQTFSQSFSALAEAGAASAADHTVVMEQTHYYVCLYDVVSGSEAGESVYIAVPQADSLYGNPRLTSAPLGLYTSVASYDALWLDGAHTIGDRDSYGNMRHAGLHAQGTLLENGVLAERGQEVGPLGAHWAMTLGEGNYTTTSRTIATTLMAKADIGGANVEATVGTESGSSHTIYEGISSTFDFQIGGVAALQDQYRAIAYVSNLLVQHAETGETRKDGLLLLDYYLDQPFIDSPGRESEVVEEAEQTAEEVKNEVGDPSGDLQAIIDQLQDLLQNPPGQPGDPYPGTLYEQLKAIWTAFWDWVESQLGGPPPYDSPAEQLLAEMVQQLLGALDGVTSPNPADPMWASAIFGMMGDCLDQVRLVFAPDPCQVDGPLPSPGGSARVYYNPTRSHLVPPIEGLDLVAGVNGEEPNLSYPMTLDEATGMFEIDVPVPDTARVVEFFFRDTFDDIDDRFGERWQIPIPGNLRTHETSQVALSVTQDGILGFSDETQSEGRGFEYPLGQNRLHIGGFWAGDATSVNNHDYDSEAADWSAALAPVSGVYQLDGVVTDITIAHFDDQAAPAPRGLHVEQVGLARHVPEDEGYVIVSYAVRNTGTSFLDDIYLGQFADFEVSTLGVDSGAVIDSVRTAYCSDGVDSYVGITLLGETAANTTLVRTGDYAGTISDAEKYDLLNGVTQVTSSDVPGDWGALVSTGPHVLRPGAWAVFACALVSGSSEAELAANASRARLWWRTHNPDTSDAPEGSSVDNEVRFFRAAPNPFGAETVVSLQLQRPADVRLQVFDVSGRRVASLHEGALEAGLWTYRWDGRDDAGRLVPAGIYLVRVSHGSEAATKKLGKLR